MEYHYTFIKDSEYITVSGSGDLPHDLSDITWTSSPGAKGVLNQMNTIDGIYAPTIGFVSVNDYPNDFYVQCAKFDSIYKYGWRFSETNLEPVPSQLVETVTVDKSEDLTKMKTKQRVYVKASKGRKGYSRMQEVGREEVDPGIENLWEITADHLSRLCSGDKQLLKEKYIKEHSYEPVEPHPKLEYLYSLMSERMQELHFPYLADFIDGGSLHEKAVAQALGQHIPVPLYVMKDYPDLAYSYEIDISEEALKADTSHEYLGLTENLYDMAKDRYDAIIETVKEDCEQDPKKITDAMLNRVYPDELADTKMAAKLRKKLFNSIPEGYQADFTPETMNSILHSNLIRYAIKNNLNIPAEVKAERPIYFADTPFKYASTGSVECDNAANDILTEIRGQCGNDLSYLPTVIGKIIGATGEQVPIIPTGSKEQILLLDEAMDRVSMLVGPDLLRRLEGYDGDPVTIEVEEGRSRACGGKEIKLGKGDIRSTKDETAIETVSHEYGHSIEHMLPEIRKLSEKFRNRRTEDEPLVHLKDVLPFSGYDDWEETRVDNFINAYIGKDYGYDATEVLSMGMGYLTSKLDTIRMYKEDPEYLGFVLAILSGRAKGTPEKEESSDKVEINLRDLTPRGSQMDKPIRARDIPMSDRVSGTTKVQGVGEVPAISVKDIQIGDRLRFTEGAFTVKDVVESGKTSLIIFEELDYKGENQQMKKQTRTKVGVHVPLDPTPVDPTEVVKFEIQLNDLNKGERVKVEGHQTKRGFVKTHYREVEGGKKDVNPPAESWGVTYDPNLKNEASAHTAHEGIVVGPAFFNYAPNEQKFIMVHETGHTFEDQVEGLNMELAGGEGAKALGHMVDTPKWLYYDGIYDEVNPSEAFATGVAELYLRPDDFKSRYPKAYDFVLSVMPSNWKEIIEGHLHEIPKIKPAHDKISKFEIPDEILEEAGIDPKKMSPDQLKIVFKQISDDGLLELYDEDVNNFEIPDEILKKYEIFYEYEEE